MFNKRYPNLEERYKIGRSKTQIMSAVLQSSVCKYYKMKQWQFTSKAEEAS